MKFKKGICNLVNLSVIWNCIKRLNILTVGNTDLMYLPPSNLTSQNFSSFVFLYWEHDKDLQMFFIPSALSWPLKIVPDIVYF